MRKCIITIISILCLSLILSSFIYKIDAVGLTIIDEPSEYEKYKQNSEDNTGAVAIGNVIVWLVRTIGQSIAIIMILIIGIKYVMGSVEEKAEYKQTMWPYVLGAVLVFAGASITDMIYKAFNR